MRFVRTLVAAAVALSSVEASAQRIKTLKFQSTRPNPAVTALGYYVGPFTATVVSDPTRPTIDIFCVDVLNQITWGHTWRARFTNLASGDLSATRHGNAKLAEYKQAAWLTTMYRAPGVNTNQWGGIQSAIWNLLNPGYPYGGTSATTNTHEAYWLAQANNWYNSAASNSFDFTRWSVVTDVGAAGRVRGGGTQEFLTQNVTPEPETWILMGTGLLIIVGFAVKRGRLV
jgi:hypothetical protein